MIKEFKEFAFKGNLIDMAVGIIIGGAFATVVKSLVDNVLMPPLGLLTGGIDFKGMKVVMKAGEAGPDGAVTVPEVALNYGQFITDSIAFLLLALAVFIVIKKVVEGMKKQQEPAPDAPPEPSAEETLLTEIRDLLKQK